MAAQLTPHADARRKLRGFFGHFPQVVHIHQRLKDLVDHEGTKDEPDGLAIVGETGTGKTTLLSGFAKRYPRVEHAEYTEVPVLYASVPARCTIKRLSGHLLQTMGSPLWNRGDEEDRTYQLKTLIKGCKLRLMLLDEVNHLGDRGASKTHYEVGDWIKQLSGDTRMPIVLVGTPTASVLWETNEQLASRYQVLTLEPLSVEAGRSPEFSSVLQAFLKMMAGLKVVDLTDDGMTRLMAFATGGRLRDIRKLLVRAISLAEETRSSEIGRDTLRRAFEQAIFEKAPAKRNPFDRAFNGLPLTAPGEPFAPRRYRK
jgi:Cdc6-like AAA superfamily ATPase